MPSARPSPPLSHVTVPDGYRLRDIQLELSLKPFFDNSAATRELVCREIFTQWQALWRHARQVSILLWVGEGSEILEFDGRAESSFEWGRYHGAPNRHRWELPDRSLSEDPDHNAIGLDIGARDPEQKGIHCRAYLYREQPAVFTYGWLRDLVRDLKQIGRETTGLPVFVGQGFDIGPEFATSRFKFSWHREILGDGPVFKEQFISCEAVLHADTRCYGAFPEGIPEGTRIGQFLGKQTRALFDLCGQDFLWLSNGFGFALETWTLVGKIFDGSHFHPEKAAVTRRNILSFWKDLRDSLGSSFNVRTRGTNLATGIDLGSDASPLEEIYRQNPAMEAPVNSPWAALDGDFGLELSGWMSHVAIHPGESFRFRFYIHDPWWLNSPWLDRYERRPHDLFLPLSVSRLCDNAKVEIPRNLAFLSVDDSHGRFPLSVPNEVSAYFLRAREFAPDAPGPIIWVYPFAEFHQRALEGGNPEGPFHADAWTGTALNAGLPINTVADARILETALRTKPSIALASIFLLPCPPAGSESERLLQGLLEAGAEILCFGPAQPNSIVANALKLAHRDPLDGDFCVLPCPLAGNTAGRTVRHLSMLSAGPWTEAPGTATPGDIESEILVEQDKNRRVAFRSVRHPSGGRIGWLRASLTTGEFDPTRPAPIRGPILKPMKDDSFIENGEIARQILAVFGWEISHPQQLFGESDHSAKRTYLTAHRHANALILSGYHQDELQGQCIRTPLGAPLRQSHANLLTKGKTSISGECAWQSEVRVLVQDGPDGVLRLRELVPAMHGVHRRILVSGLKGHRLTILPDLSFIGTLRLLPQPKFPYFLGQALPLSPETEAGHTIISTPALEGELLIEW